MNFNSKESKEQSKKKLTDSNQSPSSNNSWVDDIVSDFENRGGFDNLITKGKPLNLQEGDVF